ncbi:MAG: hypothetical protein JNM93_02345 [Bacteriovoracaceae bacterium]|nr:hypothetical protein [Bacteriovoracaceae bacterium]
MNKKTSLTVAGLSIGGGKKENFFFCLLEYFEHSQRWFLSGLHQVREEESKDSDEIISSWVNEYELEHLIVDFPLSRPVCETCELSCPGVQKCHNPVVTTVRNMMEKLLDEDTQLIQTNPKKYEQERVEDNLVHYSRNVLDKEPAHHILSKSFKRKLKSGFLPYWNRPIDFWVWQKYYDQLLTLFKISYDSFSNVSMIVLFKFKYLLRHFPASLKMLEGNKYICLIELYKSGIIEKKHIEALNSLDQQVLGRLEILRNIEKKLNVFIYEHDVDLIIKNSRAFDSFLLALSGQRYLLQQTVRLEAWTRPEENQFIVPVF